MKNLKIVKRFLLIFCLILNFSFNLIYTFATEPPSNPPSNNVSEQQKAQTPSTTPQNQPTTNRQNTYKKNITVKNNTYPQQNNATNFNSSSQNLQQTPNENQNNAITEQNQQDMEKKEEIKKDKKETSKNTGNFSTTYPEKFRWSEFQEDSEKNESVENTENKDSKPKDLPEIKDEEIVLPEVITASEIKNESSVSLLAGIVAWSCILAGIGIILFVLFMNKKGGEFPVDSEKSKKKRKPTLAKKYYKGNF